MVSPATGTLRELQLVEAEMLHRVKEICEKHGFTYYLAYGTLLGAVRHKGFIPWDDDIDIVLPYQDYCKFLKLAQAELGDDYFLQTSDTDLNYYRTYARIRKNGTTFMDKCQAGWDVHHGVWLDVFPLVEINPGVELFLKKNIVRLTNYFIMDNYFIHNEKIFLDKMGKMGVGLVKGFHKIPRNKRLKAKNKLLSFVFNGKNKKYRAAVWMGITEIVSAETYENPCSLIFEGENYSVPGQYDQQLRTIYGDYMRLPPEDKRHGHGVEMIVDLDNPYTIYQNKSITQTAQ